jgi:hypothetical protein
MVSLMKIFYTSVIGMMCVLLVAACGRKEQPAEEIENQLGRAEPPSRPVVAAEDWWVPASTEGTPVVEADVPVVDLVVLSDYFRITAIAGSEESPMLAAVLPDGRSLPWVRLGHVLPGDFVLVDVDLDDAIALFERDGLFYEGYITGDPTAERYGESVPVEPRSIRPWERSAFVERVQLESGNRVTLRTEDGREQLELELIAHRPDYASVFFQGNQYAMPTRTAEGMLSAKFMSDDERINAILSYPMLANYRAGQDVDQAVSEKRRQVMQTLTRPPAAP